MCWERLCLTQLGAMLSCVVYILSPCPAGGSAEPSSLGGCGDAETGPSPAAACGVPPSGSQSAHRVVRRLDQHEAWGGSRASPSKQQGRPADATTTKHEGLSASGAGFSLFSPVKKQRVPLFSEASSIKVGATPSKPDAPGMSMLLKPGRWEGFAMGSSFDGGAEHFCSWRCHCIRASHTYRAAQQVLVPPCSWRCWPAQPA